MKSPRTKKEPKTNPVAYDRKEIVAIVKPFRAQAVLEAIGEYDIDTVLVGEAIGYGRQKDQLPRYLGSEYSGVHLPKIQIRVLVPESQCEAVLNKIVEVARTGRIGDGKIFVFDCPVAIDL